MDNFGDLARRRRSVRRYSKRCVSGEDVLAVVRAGLMSPSGKGLKSCSFVVVDDAGVLRDLSRCKESGGEFVSGAAFAVVIVCSSDVSDTWIEDGSAAGMMMLLAAEDLGLGGCWVQVRGRRDVCGVCAEANVRRALSVPDGIRVLGIMAFGHKETERRPHSEERIGWGRVSHNRYGSVFMDVSAGM